jgi:copper chaperone CopZ
MIELHITGMTCGGCVNSVRRAVERVLPNSNPKVELGSGHLTLEVAGEVEQQACAQAIRAIEAAGFGAEAWGK